MNQLANALSPYLLQHKNNPVHWQEWGDEAFEAAKERNVPVLLSIGYSACHWCHVMAHESFEDQTTADFLNEHFVCIKVDREERPDIDNIYMQALIGIQGQGGWPLNMFLTPQRKPFFGGTYFPKEPRQGMATFLDVLKKVNEIWQTKHQELLESAEKIQQAVYKTIQAPDETNEIKFETISQHYQHLAQQFDRDYGGFQKAPKFPQTPLWNACFLIATQTQQEELLRACHQTAYHLCQGGIYDHIGGGFFRYSTDEEWLVPHFEKMLYDNALIIDWLTQLYAYSNNTLYRTRVYETIAWLKREMLLDNGCYAASLDADSEGEEGKFYVWSWQELETVLGDDLPLASQYYGLSQIGNWEGKNILHVNHTQDNPAPDQLDHIKQQLFTHRRKRIRPGQDDKVLLDWNALLVTALAKASVVFHDPELLQQAKNLDQSLKNLLREEAQWGHAYRDDKYQSMPLLEDYANIIQAALTLHGSSGERDYLNQAQTYYEEANQLFYAKDTALYHQAPLKESDTPFNPQPITGNATPAGNGVMAINSAQLHLLTGETRYASQLEKQLNTVSKALSSEHSHQLPSLVMSLIWQHCGLTIQGNWQQLKNLEAPLLPYYLPVQKNEPSWLACNHQQCLQQSNSLEQLLAELNPV